MTLPPEADQYRSPAGLPVLPSRETELGIDKGCVVVLPACLVLLGAAVVVDGEDMSSDLARGCAQVDR